MSERTIVLATPMPDSQTLGGSFHDVMPGKPIGTPAGEGPAAIILRHLDEATYPATSLSIRSRDDVRCRFESKVTECSCRVFFGTPVAATKVSASSLFHALFTSRKKLHVVIEPELQTIGFADLNMAYLAGTTVREGAHEPPFYIDLRQLSYSSGDEPRVTAIPPTPDAEQSVEGTGEPTARVMANELATFLGITLEELGAIVGVGRTTFPSWARKEPRASTIRDLLRLYSVVSTLRSKLGDDASRTWLHAGTPSPVALLRSRDVSAVETLAGRVLFRAMEAPQSLAVSGVDIYDLPKAPSNANALRRSARVIRGPATR